MEDDLRKALETLKGGGIILYPTDTVWGIGCDATNPEAIEKIFRLKQRKDSRSMLSLVDSERMLSVWVENVPDTACMLMDVAVNPLTIIYDRPKGLAKNLLAPDGSAGIRITTDQFCCRLIRKMGTPIVSTSANISGQPTPVSYHDISQKILEGVDYIVQYRQNETVNPAPSNIIKVTDRETIKVIR